MALPQQRLDINAPHEYQALRRYVDQRLAELQRTLSLLFFGRGSPENVVDAPKGALWLRTDGSTGTTMYVNETGGKTGWVAK